MVVSARQTLSLSLLRYRLSSNAILNAFSRSLLRCLKYDSFNELKDTITQTDLRQAAVIESSLEL